MFSLSSVNQDKATDINKRKGLQRFSNRMLLKVVVHLVVILCFHQCSPYVSRIGKLIEVDFVKAFQDIEILFTAPGFFEKAGVV